MADLAPATPPVPAESTPALCFAGVVVDLQGHRLLVDGRQRACSSRAMALLQLLCERPGQVWPRSELIDALWPGGQVVADESLSQLVFRLRSALGPYAEHIATVRGVGVRLDAEPEPGRATPGAALAPMAAAAPDSAIARTAEQSAQLAMPRPESTSGPGTGPSPGQLPEIDLPVQTGRGAVHAVAARDLGGRATGHRRGGLHVLSWLAVAVALAAMGWLTWSQGDGGMSSAGNHHEAGAQAVLAGGFGMRRADLGGMPDQAIALVVDGFEQDRLGDRARARALMEAASSTDDSSPVPALMLALWSAANGDGDRADGWLATADARLVNTASPYLVLLAGYVRAERSGRLPEIVRQAGALLDLRPDAWFLRLASAHVHGAMGLRERALSELKAIQFEDMDHPRLAMALADRASFGDVVGARAILAGIRPDPDNLDLALARARIDWSAGDLVIARAGFAACAELARRQARLEIRDRALAYVGILDLQADDPRAALTSLERARAGASERGIGNLELDLTLLLAHIHDELGHAEAVRAELAHAAVLAGRLPSSDMGYFTRLVALRLGPDLEPESDASGGQPGATTLVQARRALNSGNRDAARTLAEQAVAQGAMEARLAEETRLLLAELGQAPPAGPPLDPPHPPLIRFAIRRLVDRQLQILPAGPD